MSISESILAKTPLPTALDSREIRERIAPELRRRAFFSARMATMSYLKPLQRICAAYADGTINTADARLRLMTILDGLGLSDGSGGLTDHGSVRRLELILKTQHQMAASAARLELQDEGVLELWPAWRLERYGSRRAPREDWAVRWYAAGQAVGWEGAHRSQMVALKTSPIWKALGDGAGGFKDTLGNPYPPFAYSSGLDWSDVSAEEAARLGLVYDGQKPRRASLSPADAEIREAVRKTGFPTSIFTPPTPVANTAVANSNLYKCSKCGKFAHYDGSCDHCGTTLESDAMIQRGREALSRALDGKPRDIKGAMHKPGLGSIDFYLGYEGKGPLQEYGKGLRKIIQKHRRELDRLPETVAKGKVYALRSKATGKLDPNRKAIVYGTYIAFLSKNKNRWVVTSHYQSENTARAIGEGRY